MSNFITNDQDLNSVMEIVLTGFTKEEALQVLNTLKEDNNKLLERVQKVNELLEKKINSYKTPVIGNDYYPTDCSYLIDLSNPTIESNVHLCGKKCKLISLPYQDEAKFGINATMIYTFVTIEYESKYYRVLHK